MTWLSNAKRHLILIALISAALGYGAHLLFADALSEHEKIVALENTIKNLESALAEKEEQLKALSQPTAPLTVTNNSENAGVRSELTEQDRAGQTAGSDHTQRSTPSSVEILKDLETTSDSDPRTFSEKLKEFLSTSTHADKTAIASRSIFDMASNRDSLPDYALQSIYNQQADPDLKRVIAQVLSQRGNHLLLDTQIAEAQAQLKSVHATDRQNALNQLAKTRSAKAVDAIAPYLLDADINVKLDALNALRDTGNQKHLSLIETLIHDPDPSVSSLAGDVSSQLKNLSSSARSTPSRTDIEATLPPLASP
jgi:hypothetical protein